MKNRIAWVLGFTLFSLFFGAGNLILPPQLGFKAGSLWWVAALGFSLSAVAVPMLGILAHARLQGSMFDFARKVTPAFSLVYCLLVYAISLSLPAPRTASVTHEMAIAPYFDSPPWLTSLLYFGFVFAIAVNRSRVSDLIGKLLTPAILLVLLLILGNLLLAPPSPAGIPRLDAPLRDGILEGYQTFDAIGAVVVGGVILVSLRLKHPALTADQRFRTVSGAGRVAGIALLLLYAGLMACGAFMAGLADSEVSRTQLLGQMSTQALGVGGTYLLSVLIALACFTTAVGIVTGTADFIKSRFGESERAYTFTALAGCLIGVLMGQGSVAWIIDIALPALMFIYPLTIVLIGMNALPLHWTPPGVFRAVVGVTLLFSLPDFLASVGVERVGEWGWRYLPLHDQGLGWLLPAVAVYCLAQAWRLVQGSKSMAKGEREIPEK